MTTDTLIEKFAAKHHLTYTGPTGDGVHAFEGGHFFSDGDITIDLEKEVPVGLIELYMREATEGIVHSFGNWLIEHKHF